MPILKTMSENGETETREAVTVKGIKNKLFPCPICGNVDIMLSMNYPTYIICCKLCRSNTIRHVDDVINSIYDKENNE